MEHERNDVVVIGGGAAGRSAALVLGRARRSVVLVDAGRPSNAVSSGIGGLLGHDQQSPADFYATTDIELARYPTIRRQQGEAGSVEQLDDGWAVHLDDGTVVDATHVVLAMGMRYDVPAIPGVEPLWGASVFHCPFCHGWEHRDEPLVMLAGGPEPARRALLLRNWSPDVTVVSPPDTAEADRAALDRTGLPVLDGEIAALRADGRQLEAVELADGRVVPARGLMVPAPHQQRSSLAEDLGVKIDETGHLVVDGHGRTSVAGIWAAGDLTTPFASVANAVAQGSLTAVTVVHDLTVG